MNRSSLIALIFVLAISGSCKKSSNSPSVTYSTVNITISLVDYSWGRYASGSWASSTKVRIRCYGNVIDSLVPIVGAYTLPVSSAVSNGCSAHFQSITHTFRIQNGAINQLDIMDQTGVRASYDVVSTAVYFSSVSDTTTTNISNSGCPMSIFPAR